MLPLIRRAPLYLFELLGVIGILLQVRSLAGGAALALIFLLQVMRARWEEEVLACAIPEFTAYRRRVPFLIPRHPQDLLALLRNDLAARQRCGLMKSVASGICTCARGDPPFGGQAPPTAVFNYSCSWAGEHPQGHLADHVGLMQADALFWTQLTPPGSEEAGFDP